jgi:magnesium transporter
MRRFLHKWLTKNHAPVPKMHHPKDAAPTFLPQITVVDFLDTGLDTHTLDSIEQIIPSVKQPYPTWIDIIHPSAPILEKLGEIFSLHRLTLEDIVHLEQRPKVESFDDYMYIVIQKPGFLTTCGKIQMQQVSILLTAHTVVCIDEKTI